MTCLKTGCELRIPDEGKVLWGDLHILETCFVFNGCLDEKGEAAWNYAEPNPHEFGVKLLPSALYFERRGVLTVPINCVELTQKLQEYL